MAGSQHWTGLTVKSEQKTADRVKDEHGIKSSRHSNNSTMALEIPSLNSTDLNNIVYSMFKYRTCGQQYRSPMTTSVVPDNSDTELSPEPRTPQFSSSSGLTFQESNRNFGFSFQISNAHPPQGLTLNAQTVSKTVPNSLPQPAVTPTQAATATIDHLHAGTSVFEGQRQVVVNTETKFQSPVEVETRSPETPVQYVLQSPSPGFREPLPQPTYPNNIPTTVLESVQTSKDHFPQASPQDLPRVLVTGKDGKTASFIRFLNEPIPYPNDIECKMLNIEGYRRPPEEASQDGADVRFDNTVVADIDAIQRMEEEPVIRLDEEPVIAAQENDPTTYQSVQYIQYEPANAEAVGVDFQAVPDDTQGVEPVVYYQMIQSDDCENDMCGQGQGGEEIMEVAAYQSVDETQNASDVLTFTELTPRPPSLPPDHTRQDHPQELQDDPRELQDPEIQPEVQNGDSPESTSTEIFTTRFGERFTNASDEAKRAAMSAVKENSVRPLLKLELKNKIQLKRLKEGKGELKVSFEDRPIGEPSEEEKTKATTRKMKNRESAVKSRKKREQHLQNLQREVKDLERENKQLVREIKQLKANMAQDLQEMLEMGCSCEIINGDDSIADSARAAPAKSLQEAICDVLASEQFENT
ncbi:uncharacterized protein [Haliotis cracherodii]|uniref:uncharacterized protein n=1 Tax=Haliotis cracherodii TaxID=6455 RepID=UPI0039E90CEB